MPEGTTAPRVKLALVLMHGEVPLCDARLDLEQLLSIESNDRKKSVLYAAFVELCRTAVGES